jgi:hypothetical protein
MNVVQFTQMNPGLLLQPHNKPIERGEKVIACPRLGAVGVPQAEGKRYASGEKIKRAKLSCEKTTDRPLMAKSSWYICKSAEEPRETGSFAVLVPETRRDLMV